MKIFSSQGYYPYGLGNFLSKLMDGIDAMFLEHLGRFTYSLSWCCRSGSSGFGFCNLQCPWWVMVGYESILHMLDFGRFVGFCSDDGIGAMSKAVDYGAFVGEMVIGSKVQVLVRVCWFTVYCSFDGPVVLQVN